jgi:hypothetical protein
MGARAEALARRVEQGAMELHAAVQACSEADWETICPNERRSVGTLVHHVAVAYPAEMQLVRVLAAGQPIADITWDSADRMNAQHAAEHANPDKGETLTLLRTNSAAAAAAIRALTDELLDRAATVSLHDDAPLTTQYFIEQHPFSHAYSHLASIRTALRSPV